MSVQVWPSELPRPNRKQWQSVPQDTRNKKSPKSGPPSYGKGLSRAVTQVSIALDLTFDQRQVFDRFFHQECNEGVILFWMPDPIVTGRALTFSNGMPLLNEGGQPLIVTKTWLCRWGDNLPTETIPSQLHYRKTFSLWVGL